MSSNHRIETLRWDARFSHARLAQTQQDRLSQFIHKHALPRLAERFDAISPAGEVWALDRLEVDMGQLRIQDSPTQWLQQFDQALQRSLAGLLDTRAQASEPAERPTGSASTPGQRHSLARHELGQFLHYLQHGLLPWGMPLRSARDLAGWLQRLALQHGSRLWQALQQLMPPEPVLARLALIAPHQGLQALLSVRHRELAEAFVLIDESWLLPLQRRGRLSAYQVQSLQQRLRVAGLHALWGLSGGALGGARQRRLLAALQAGHAELLGPGWASLRRALRGQVLPRQPGSELAAAMLAALLGDDSPAQARAEAEQDTPRPAAAAQPHREGPSRPSTARQVRASESSAPLPEPTPSPLSQAALRRLQTLVQAWACGQVPAGAAAQLGHSLQELQRRDPAALRRHLLEQLRQRGGRRVWSQTLPLEQRWTLLALLDGRRLAQPEGQAQQVQALSPAPPQWADSLRQTAAQLLQRCPASERPGLSAMQSLLMEASLAHVLEHGRLPATHSAWLALWHGAWARWQGLSDPALERAAESAHAAASSSPSQDLTQWQTSPWLPPLIARWQPPAPQPEPELETQALGAERPTARSARPLTSPLAWPAASLRRWLWQETEALITATPPQHKPLVFTPSLLEAHWRRRWLEMHKPLCASALGSSSPPPEQQSQGQQALQALWLQVQSQAYGPAQRLRLAELLEQPAACDNWCRQFEESQRWQWLAAQFGPGPARALRACMEALGREAPKAQRAPPASQLWPLLCEHLFVRGGPADAAAFRRHWQASVMPSTSAPKSKAPADRPAPPHAAAPSKVPKPGAEDTALRGPLAAPIWVEDAGQVLLAAYTERLFKHLGLIANGQFIDAHAQARAVLCLQALVRGEAASSEPLWPLSKLLCGLAPNHLLPACEPLKAEEHALLKDLLAAVVSHWKAIGNTSVEGLRESFLQREGRLERQRAEAGEPAPWRLKVQPRAFDMLLDRLPWGFSIIKLPWMQGVLHVEWR